MFDLESELVKKREAGLYRSRRVNASAQGVRSIIDGKRYLSFCSNDYLGLANHPAVKAAFIEAVENYGVGSGAAHLINGHNQLHHDCEQRLADFTGRDRALLFSNGYMANLAIASALLGRRDLVFQDKLNHASLIDAARLSRAKLLRYRHNDLDQLEVLLQDNQTEFRRLLMTDAVFSMDGDCADMVSISALCAQHSACCMVDDAHGFGVLGKNGGGLLQLLGLSQQQVPILMATLGKAAGVAGAFVAGSEALIESLIQQARPYIYTTAAPPAISAATMCSLDIIQQQSWRRHKLADLIDYLQRGVNRLPYELMPSKTPIQPVIVGDSFRALELSESLMAQGILVSAIRPPTVPADGARLRITLSAAHEKADIDSLLRALAEVSLT
ncbi:MAG: 8-amino-7-oxononanoate synthase [Gammaproteobacteria bacterium]|nr:8-amino-7-oxononanoate synthase [Gammaproteobacteria bacterium]